ncbi:type II toxin-antitoxin system death-on-curing family toxin [Rhizobium sp. SG2393]|uniref:type II toxin-antitoxin system death-on-curing family toxin n=1 Tax=Rhizobium sp. SG2393 TaxID=3276279 RepID=UPI00366B9018
MRGRSLSRNVFETIQSEYVTTNGGLAGLSNSAALEAVLNAANELTAGERPDLFKMAAMYLCQLARTRPFADANAQTAFVCSFAFLLLNGHMIEASHAEIVVLMLDIAAGEIDEAGAAAFLADHTVPYPA